MAELETSARALGTARVETLGYADSGLGPETFPDPPGRVRFVRADPEEAAERLAAILREEQADVLLAYDANGGYGHRDHKKVHHVGARAAELAGTPRVLQATVPRDLLVRATGSPRGSTGSRRSSTGPRSTAPSAPAARSPTGSPCAGIVAEAGLDARPRLTGQRRRRGRPDAGRLPAHTAPLFDLVFGREWYVDAARPAGAGVSHDVFD